LTGCFGAIAQKQPISVFYFEFEIMLKFYNLEPSSSRQTFQKLEKVAQVLIGIIQSYLYEIGLKVINYQMNYPLQ
ncbi:MAG: hypothetical protein AB2693_26500, partial [Candidatus Thiodiazotropha sp.]